MLHPVFDRFTNVEIAHEGSLYDEFAFHLFGFYRCGARLTILCEPSPSHDPKASLKPFWMHRWWRGWDATPAELQRVVALLRQKPNKTAVEVRALEKLETRIEKLQTLETSHPSTAAVQTTVQ